MDNFSNNVKKFREFKLFSELFFSFRELELFSKLFSFIFCKILFSLREILAELELLSFEESKKHLQVSDSSELVKVQKFFNRSKLVMNSAPKLNTEKFKSIFIFFEKKRKNNECSFS